MKKSISCNFSFNVCHDNDVATLDDEVLVSFLASSQTKISFHNIDKIYKYKRIFEKKSRMKIKIIQNKIQIIYLHKIYFNKTKKKTYLVFNAVYNIELN